MKPELPSPTVGQHRLLARLRQRREGASDLYELTDVEAARAVAAHEAEAVDLALTLGKAKVKFVRLLLNEYRNAGRLDMGAATELLNALRADRA